MKLNRYVQAAIAALLITSFLSCQKEEVAFTGKIIAPAAAITARKMNTGNTFTTYTIRKRAHYCEHNSYPPFNAPALYFTVQFDSSAVYKNIDPLNQNDENKLYGFSDNNSMHHQYSARFGWHWCNGELELSAYTYNNGICSDKVLGAIAIGAEYTCAIIVQGDRYDFLVNGITTSVSRESKTPQVEGYKLLPYFGGDEAAPHTITIKIREYKGV